MERLTRKTKSGNYTGADTTVLIRQVYDKMGVYEDAEEQGLLLKLPVAKGCKIYPLLYANGRARYIDEIEVLEVSDNRIWAGNACFDYDDIGKTVFLTQAEAEEALKRMESIE